MKHAANALRNPSLTVPATLVYFTTPGDYTDAGTWEPGQTAEREIRVVTAPVSGKDRDLLPEGLRLSDVRKFWTLERADTVRPGANDGDVIRYAGNEYRVTIVDDWGGFRELTAVRPDP